MAVKITNTVKAHGVKISANGAPPTPGAPVANFYTLPTNTGDGTLPFTPTFTDLSTNSPTSWLWDFGDGGTSTLQNPTHAYTTGGRYTVTLTATNASGSSAPYIVPDYIVAPPAPAPVSSFTGTPSTGDAPLTVNFTDTSTNSPTTWYWQFGDGGTASTQNPSYAYNTPGSYNVTLTAGNSYWAGSPTTVPGYITANTPIPTTPAMILSVDTTSYPAGTVQLPFYGISSPLSIDWGDGTVTTLSSDGLATYDYPTPGAYTVTVTGAASTYGDEGIANNVVTEVTQFGLGVSSVVFKGYGALTTLPTTLTPEITSLYEIVRDCPVFNSDITGWDTSLVTDMSYAFAGATSFNQDLSSWDVSSVGDMSYMFWGATSFNSPVNWATVSSVGAMKGMFTGATSFNQTISWDSSGVADMSNMFDGATSFNSPVTLDGSSVTTTASMFRQATSFYQAVDLGASSMLENIVAMFDHATAFNSPIIIDTSSVTNMNSVFNFASVFNQDISGWSTSNVQHMDSMFSHALVFNSDISGWDVSSVETFGNMFWNTGYFNAPIGSWNIMSATNMTQMFYYTGSTIDLSAWDVSNIPAYPTHFATGTTGMDAQLILGVWTAPNLPAAWANWGH